MMKTRKASFPRTPFARAVALLGGLLSLGAIGYALGYALIPWSAAHESATATMENLPEPAPATELPADRSVADVVRLCSAKTAARFAPLCRSSGIAYPPKRVRLLAFKAEKILEVWGADRTGPYRFLAAYPIQAASGQAGPKRREGDRQVPEGFYRLTTLNPRSRFHVSIRVDYPNAHDIAANPGVPRSQLGGDIYIHGGAASIGCLAMGDAAIEEIFCLVAQAGAREVWIAPQDPRSDPLPRTDDPDLRRLYDRLARSIQAMPR